MVRLSIDELIARLNAALQKRRPDFYKCLQPGLTNAQILSLEEKVGVTLPDDFKKFYAWKNGQNIEAGRFVANYDFMDVNGIIYTVEMMNHMTQGGEFDRANWWNIGWIPFLYNGGGDSVCLDLAGSFNGEIGQIIEFWHASADRDITHQSFYKWLETLVLAMESGVLPYDDNDDYYDEFKVLEAKNNPGYPIENIAK